MTVRVTRWNQPARSLRRFAAGGLVLAFLAACSNSASVHVAKPATTAAPSTAPGATIAAPVASTVPASVDLNLLLGAYASGYQFTTTLTIGGAVTATFQGRRFGGATTLLVTQGGLTIDEVITAAGAWVRSPGQEWTQVDSPANTDPLLPLRSPQSVSVKPDGTVAAVYPAETFGLAKGDLPVVLTLAGGVLSKVRYDTTVAGKPAIEETTFAALTDTTPITAPK